MKPVKKSFSTLYFLRANEPLQKKNSKEFHFGLYVSAVTKPRKIFVRDIIFISLTEITFGISNYLKNKIKK